jgi:hypothetical protein
MLLRQPLIGQGRISLHGKAACSAACSVGGPLDVTFTTQIVRGGLNYKF